MILFDQGKLVMPLLQLELLFTICDATAFPKLRDALRDVTPSPPINHKVVVRLVVVVFVYVLGGGGGAIAWLLWPIPVLYPPRRQDGVDNGRDVLVHEVRRVSCALQGRQLGPGDPLLELGRVLYGRGRILGAP